jgi:hypothetical protein
MFIDYVILIERWVRRAEDDSQAVMALREVHLDDATIVRFNIMPYGV